MIKKKVHELMVQDIEIITSIFTKKKDTGKRKD